MTLHDIALGATSLAARESNVEPPHPPIFPLPLAHDGLLQFRRCSQVDR